MQKIKKVPDLTVLNSPEETDYFVGYDVDQADPDKATVLIPVAKGRNIIVDSITALEALTGTVDGQVVKVKGYYAGVPLDMPDYNTKPDSVKTPNGGSVIARPEGGNFEWPEVAVVDPKHFGAKGDAVWNASTETLTTLGTDDTVAIQSAINTGLDVYFGGGGVYRVSNTLTIRNQKIYGNRNTDATARYRYTCIVTTSSNPIIQNDNTDFLQMEIKNLRLCYDSTVTINTSSRGIYFSDQFPFNYSIENVEVYNGYYGFYDVSGSFQSNIKNCTFSGCEWNFFKIGGTTIKCDTVYCTTGARGFYFEEVLSVTMVNCASDGLSLGNTFVSVPTLTIVGWDAENNIIGNYYGLFYFDDCQGVFNGFTGINNKLQPDVAAPAALFYAVGSVLDISGICPCHNKVGSYLEFSGPSGSSGIVIRSEGSRVKVSGSYIQVPVVAVGSISASVITLQNVSNSTGRLLYENCYIENGDDNTVRAQEIIPIGYTQTYTDVSSSRSLGTLYVNETDRPITLNVSIRATTTGTFAITAQIETINVHVYAAVASGSSDVHPVNIVVPSGYSYQINVTNGSINTWYELR